MEKKMYKNILTVSIITLVLVVLNYFVTYFVIMQIEYNKVGGKENYDILYKLQIEQIESLVSYYKENPDLMDMSQEPMIPTEEEVVNQEEVQENTAE